VNKDSKPPVLKAKPIRPEGYKQKAPVEEKAVDDSLNYDTYSK
jgi:hypothetical protein